MAHADQSVAVGVTIMVANFARLVVIAMVVFCASVASPQDVGQSSTGCLLLELVLSSAGNDTLLSWDDRSEAQSYCVERGNLDVLRTTRGDFTLSIAEELTSHTTEASLLFGGTPEHGQAYWFLVRDNPDGTFDSGCLSQVDNRDDEILNAGDICVN